MSAQKLDDDIDVGSYLSIDLARFIMIFSLSHYYWVERGRPQRSGRMVQ